jgi:hypothetical protein
MIILAIELPNAFNTSYRLILGSAEDKPEVARALEGQTGHTGSITAKQGGVMPLVVSLSIPQAPTSRRHSPSPWS